MSQKKARAQRRNAPVRQKTRPAQLRPDELTIQESPEEFAAREKAFYDEIARNLTTEFHGLPDATTGSQGVALAVNYHAVPYSPGDARLASFLMCSVLDAAGIPAQPITVTREGSQESSVTRIANAFSQAATGLSRQRPRPTTAVLMDSPGIGPAIVDLCSYDDLTFYDGRDRMIGRPTLVTVGAGNFADLAEREDDWAVASPNCRYDAYPFEGEQPTADEADAVRVLTPKVITTYREWARDLDDERLPRWE